MIGMYSLLMASRAHENLNSTVEIQALVDHACHHPLLWSLPVVLTL